jgi:hypothetical protein
MIFRQKSREAPRTFFRWHTPRPSGRHGEPASVFSSSRGLGLIQPNKSVLIPDPSILNWNITSNLFAIELERFDFERYSLAANHLATTSPRPPAFANRALTKRGLYIMMTPCSPRARKRGSAPRAVSPMNRVPRLPRTRDYGGQDGAASRRVLEFSQMEGMGSANTDLKRRTRESRHQK